MKGKLMKHPEKRISAAQIVNNHGGDLERMLNCIAEFHAKFGCWPQILRLSHGANKVLLDYHLTSFGYAILSEKLHLIVSADDEGPLIAEDSNSRRLDYGVEGWSGKSLAKADLWLWGISIHGGGKLAMNITATSSKKS